MHMERVVLFIVAESALTARCGLSMLEENWYACDWFLSGRRWDFLVLRTLIVLLQAYCTMLFLSYTVPMILLVTTNDWYDFKNEGTERWWALRLSSWRSYLRQHPWMFLYVGDSSSASWCKFALRALIQTTRVIGKGKGQPWEEKGIAESQNRWFPFMFTIEIDGWVVLPISKNCQLMYMYIYIYVVLYSHKYQWSIVSQGLSWLLSP